MDVGPGIQFSSRDDRFSHPKDTELADSFGIFSGSCAAYLDAGNTRIAEIDGRSRVGTGIAPAIGVDASFGSGRLEDDGRDGRAAGPADDDIRSVS